MTVPSSPPNQRRLLIGAAAVAALAGAGVAWWRHRPGDVAQANAQADAFWAASFTDLTGQTVPASRWRGKPLLLNFWATWCPPCIEELPLLNRFGIENASSGPQLLALAVDKPEAVRKFWSPKGWTLPVVIGGGEALAVSRALGNDGGGLPFSVLFDAKGQVLTQKVGQLSAKDLAHWRSLALG